MKPGMIKPIETVYNGYRFRSRLEARWAVFFDTLGIPYRYELEGYDLGDEWYLPDFWFPHSVEDLAKEGWGLFGEIKPFEASRIELRKVRKLVEGTKHNALIFQGDPWPDSYFVTKVSGTHFKRARVWPAKLQFREEFSSFEFEGHIYRNGRTVSLEGGGFSSYPLVYNKEQADVIAAYEAARQARFEHGENGRKR